MGRHVLFLCTGNFYRSRFAEHLFNHLAHKGGLDWTSVSRALALDAANLNSGPISPHAVMGLVERGLRVQPDVRAPLSATEADFAQADLLIALHEGEHRPMIEQLFPRWASRVRYWNICDVTDAPPSVVLPQLEREVRNLVETLKRA